jgi:capsular exopolysaccharide synthesis family protein
MAETWGATVPPLDVRDYLRVLWRRRWTILLVVILAVGIALALARRQDQVYRSSGQIVLGAQNLSTSDVTTQARVLESQSVHALAQQKLPQAIGVSTAVDGSSNLITVSARSNDPVLAADSVNATIDAYVEYTRKSELDQYLALAQDTQARLNSIFQQIAAYPPTLVPVAPGQGTGDPQLDALISQRDLLAARLRALQVDTPVAGSDVNVVARATPSSDPVSPKPTQDALIALGAGLLLGIAMAFLFELLDDSIKTGDDLERVVGPELPLLGQIPRFRSRRHPLVMLSSSQSAAAESFRSLRTALSFVALDRGSCFEITSARAREEQTVTVTNLAIATAQAGRRVVLVDCDLRRPGIDELLGLPNDRGFTSVVRGQALLETLQRVPGVENLYVLTSGPPPSNPSEVLASDRSHDILTSLQADGAVVYVHAPPLLPVTDAAVLTGEVDGVIVVASAGRSTRKHVRRAVGVLRQVSAPIVGFVLTSTMARGSSSYYRGAQASATPDDNGRDLVRAQRKLMWRARSEPSSRLADIGQLQRVDSSLTDPSRH